MSVAFDAVPDTAVFPPLPNAFDVLPMLPPDDAPPPLSEETLSLSSSLHALIKDSGSSRYSGVSKNDVVDIEDMEVSKRSPC